MKNISFPDDALAMLILSRRSEGISVGKFWDVIEDINAGRTNDPSSTIVQRLSTFVLSHSIVMKQTSILVTVAAAASGILCACMSISYPTRESFLTIHITAIPRKPHLLAFSKTVGYRHERYGPHVLVDRL